MAGGRSPPIGAVDILVNRRSIGQAGRPAGVHIRGLISGR